MSDFPARRRGTYGLADAHARQVSADRHSGQYTDFLRRHVVEAQQIAHATRQEQARFAQGLLARAGDTRNVMCAIEHCVKKGKAAGPNGTRLTELTRREWWELARHLSPLISSGEYTPGEVRVVEIDKGGNRGTRPIRIQDQEDKVVERAVLQIIRPILDPQYRETNNGFRPGRGRERALATAEHFARQQGRWCWMSEDLRDAFEHVPHARLRQVLNRMIPANDLCDFIARLTRQPGGRGIRQGGPLSPELLNVYLHWMLDRWWAQAHPDSPLIRVADDLLILTRKEMAERLYGELAQRVLSAGMQLKHTLVTAHHELDSGQAATWLGYRLSQGTNRLTVQLHDRSWNRLGEHLALAWEEPTPTLSAQQGILGWVGQQGAAYDPAVLRDHYARITQTSRLAGFDEFPSLQEVHSRWHHAYLRWVRVRRETMVRLGRLGSADGSADRHCENAAIFGRRASTSQTDLRAQNTPARREVYLYCDGSCFGVRGVGGWAWLLIEPISELRQFDCGYDETTTNNRMELEAVIRGLAALPDRSRVKLVVDSEYVSLGITERLHRWIEDGWRTGTPGRSRPIKNRRYWQRLAEQLQRHEIDCRWVRGHSGHAENEFVDRLANEAAQRGRQRMAAVTP